MRMKLFSINEFRIFLVCQWEKKHERFNSMSFASSTNQITISIMLSYEATLWKHITNKLNQIIDKVGWGEERNESEHFKLIEREVTEALCKSICSHRNTFSKSVIRFALNSARRCFCLVICKVTLTFQQIEYTSNKHEAIFAISSNICPEHFQLEFSQITSVCLCKLALEM